MLVKILGKSKGPSGEKWRIGLSVLVFLILWCEGGKAQSCAPTSGQNLVFTDTSTLVGLPEEKAIDGIAVALARKQSCKLSNRQLLVEVPKVSIGGKIQPPGDVRPEDWNMQSIMETPLLFFGHVQQDSSPRALSQVTNLDRFVGVPKTADTLKRLSSAEGILKGQKFLGTNLVQLVFVPRIRRSGGEIFLAPVSVIPSRVLDTRLPEHDPPINLNRLGESLAAVGLVFTGIVQAHLGGIEERHFLMAEDKLGIVISQADLDFFELVLDDHLRELKVNAMQPKNGFVAQFDKFWTGIEQRINELVSGSVAEGDQGNVNR